jgi:hypothetical protein
VRRIATFALAILISNFGYPNDWNTELARLMRGQSGTAVLVDVRSGHILAAYHPEVAARRLARPGSAFKPFTLLAPVEVRQAHFHGFVGLQTKSPCRHARPFLLAPADWAPTGRVGTCLLLQRLLCHLWTATERRRT